MRVVIETEAGGNFILDNVWMFGQDHLVGTDANGNEVIVPNDCRARRI